MKNYIVDAPTETPAFIPDFKENGEMNAAALSQLHKEVRMIQGRAEHARKLEAQYQS